MVGGVFVIEAADMGDVIRTASLHPIFQVDAGEHLGWRLDIRAIHHFEKR